LSFIVLLKREHIIQLINVNMCSFKYTVYIVQMLLFPFLSFMWNIVIFCSSRTTDSYSCFVVLFFFFLRMSFPLLILGVVVQVYSLIPISPLFMSIDKLILVCNMYCLAQTKIHFLLWVNLSFYFLHLVYVSIGNC
jgi:hypothetical protein